MYISGSEKKMGRFFPESERQKKFWHILKWNNAEPIKMAYLKNHSSKNVLLIIKLNWFLFENAKGQ